MNDVTIIIPVGGHHSRYVCEAVQSCFAGPVHPKRVIVVDDHAQPPVRLQRDPRILLLCPAQHIGRSAARNLAARDADTDWLYFLDADDWLEPTALSDFDATVNNGIDLLYADYQYRDGMGTHPVRKQLWRYKFRDQRNLVNIGMFVKRERFYKVGGFDDDVAMAEYWDFFIRYTANPKVKVVKGGRPYFTARAQSSVHPKAKEALESGSDKIAALIRGGYYDKWRKI